MNAIPLTGLVLFLTLRVTAAQETNLWVRPETTNGITAIRKAAEQNDKEAQMVLGAAYEHGIGVINDFQEAVKWYRKSADQGVAQAQYYLGNMYFGGHGVETNYVEAIKWLRLSAGQGYAEGQLNLADCYFSGKGVDKDEIEAMKWARKAAEQNDKEAQMVLGSAYEHGTGVTNDFQEAVKWYRKSADQGVAQAQYYLGNMYFWGHGVETNYDESIKWFRLSADQGNTDAEYKLASFYFFGVGVPKDYSEAFKWSFKAADQGIVLAQYDVAVSYLIGMGIPQDKIEAYKWFNLSAARGNQDAKTQREALEQQMTLEEIAKAQKLTREYKPGLPATTATSIPKGAQQELQVTGYGSGFFITGDGYLISNYHVVKDAAKVRVLTGTGLIDATVVKVDAANDLVLLQAVGRFAPLPIASSRTVKLGGTVATVGFPDIGLQGLAPKLAKGEIASLSGPTDDPRYFQISLPVQPGNSGGALVDTHGNVVGIVAAKLDASAALAASGALPENVNYAVKSSLLLNLLESVPDVGAKLKEPNTKDESFEDVVKTAQDAAVLVLVY